MVIINYNIGTNSKTIIADEVFSQDISMAFATVLSDQEKNHPLDVIHDFFHALYPIPKSRSNLIMLTLKATLGKKVNDPTSLSEMFLFVKHYKKLLEASYLISRYELPETVVTKTSKKNLIPAPVLALGSKLFQYQTYLPSSPDPEDALDPIKNLRFIFAEKNIEELLGIFDQIYQCSFYCTKGSTLFYQDHLLNHIIFNMILDSCHLVYVRTIQPKLIYP